MATLVVYYSKTGNTKKIAEEIVSLEGGDLMQIEEKNPSKSGGINIIGAGISALRGKKTEIKPLSHVPSEYSRIYVGSPVWADNMPPAVRGFLDSGALNGKEVFLFSTHGGGGAKKFFCKMAEVLPKSNILGSFAICDKEIKKGNEKTHVKDALTKLEVLNGKKVSAKSAVTSALKKHKKDSEKVKKPKKKSSVSLTKKTATKKKSPVKKTNKAKK